MLMNINLRLKRFGMLILIVGFVSSCMVGPNYVRPKVLVPPKFKEAKASYGIKKWKPIQPQDKQERGEWWRIFHDSTLNDLEVELNRYNQSIVQTEANYKQALAIVDEARAGLFPTLSGSASLFRQKQGGGTSTVLSTTGGATTTSIATSNTTLAKTPTTTIYSSVLNASWEPDIWGLVRRSIEANVALAQSDAALVGVTRLSAQSALAQYYFELRTVDLNQKLLENTVFGYQKMLRLTRNQYSSGVATRADILQAQTQLESAQSQALNNGILRGQYEHAIAVLIGRPPAFLSLKMKNSTLNAPNIPTEIPSIWLERRPDVAQAERLVQNASALIGVAVAAFYPNLSLTGSASASGRGLSKLIHTPALAWSTGLLLADTFFDGGFRTAKVNATKANYEAQVAAYRQVVLIAFQDVEDNLIALRLLKEQRKVQQQAAAHAKQALQLMTNQYKAGTVDFASVITAQILAYNAQKTANDVSGLEMTAAVGLVKALGGGWRPNAEL